MYNLQSFQACLLKRARDHVHFHILYDLQSTLYSPRHPQVNLYLQNLRVSQFHRLPVLNIREPTTLWKWLVILTNKLRFIFILAIPVLIPRRQLLRLLLPQIQEYSLHAFRCTESITRKFTLLVSNINKLISIGVVYINFRIGSTGRPVLPCESVGNVRCISFWHNAAAGHLIRFRDG